MSENEKVKEAFLTADEILNMDDIRVHPFKVPEWNGRVVGLKNMSAAETLAYRAEMKKSEAKKDEAFISMFAASVCREDGALLFKKQDVMKLKEKSAAVFFRLQHKILEINGMTRRSRTWEALLPLLEEAGVDGAVIARIEAKWDTPEDDAKND